MAAHQHVEIVEVGPRDGLQSEPGVLPTATKVEFIRRAVAAGLRRIEVASFVNPRRVPQMADAEAVLQALPAQAGVQYVGLVLNRKGFERAAAAGCSEIGMAVMASETFSQRNQGCAMDDAVAAWLDIAARARQAGIRAQVTVSVAFGCPFEGEVPVARVVELARRLAEAEPVEIALADTIGVGVPSQVTELVARVREAVPGVALRCHFHNTRNTGLANAYAAVQAGVSDAGREPRRHRRLPVRAGGDRQHPDRGPRVHAAPLRVRDGGRPCGSDRARVEWLQAQLGRPVPGMLVKAGDFPGSALPAA